MPELESDQAEQIADEPRNSIPLRVVFVHLLSSSTQQDFGPLISCGGNKTMILQHGDEYDTRTFLVPFTCTFSCSRSRRLMYVVALFLLFKASTDGVLVGAEL